MSQLLIHCAFLNSIYVTFNITTIFFYLFFFSLLFNTLYYIFLMIQGMKVPVIATLSERCPISILVCTRNGKNRLPGLIERLVDQDYYCYEILLIDDNSTDGTWEYLQDLENTYSVIRTFHIESTRPGKKEALYYGLSKAKYAWIAVTDDDCLPSKEWLAVMSEHRSPSDHFILGYSPYKREKGVLNKLIRYETVLTAIQYFGWALAGKPYMGVGRNMMFKKEGTPAYEQLHPELASGDDDLMIAGSGTGDNTGVCMHKDAFVYSVPKQSWKTWWAQKKRHVTTARHYGVFHKVLLSIYGGSQILILLSIPLLFTTYWGWVLSFLLMRYLLLFPLFSQLFNRFEARDLLFELPLLDMGMSIVYLLLIPDGLFGKGMDW